MGVERVATAGEVVAHLDTVAGGDRGHSLLHRLCLRERPAVLGGEVARVVELPLPRRGRIELEAAPPHPDLLARLERGERGFEPALADIAPRTGHV